MSMKAVNDNDMMMMIRSVHDIVREEKSSHSQVNMLCATTLIFNAKGPLIIDLELCHRLTRQSARADCRPLLDDSRIMPGRAPNEIR